MSDNLFVHKSLAPSLSPAASRVCSQICHGGTCTNLFKQMENYFIQYNTKNCFKKTVLKVFNFIHLKNKFVFYMLTDALKL